VTWLLLTGVGFVAETAVIVALGRSATAASEAGRPDRRAPARTERIR
jgi:hypothetical protein